MIKFYQIYCGSNCTGPYSVEISKPMTVKEFIDELLSEYPSEWGDIRFRDLCCRYSRGKLYDSVPDKYLDRQIEEVSGGGGWTYSVFNLRLKETEEERRERWLFG